MVFLGLDFINYDDCIDQWFSIFLVERNPNETFQRLEEPLCINLILICKKNYLINIMRLTYLCSDLLTIKIQTEKKVHLFLKKFNEKFEPGVSYTTP